MAEASADQEFRDAASTAAQAASDVLGGLKDAADTLIEDQKARVADTVQGFAQALRKSADAFAEEGSDAVARAANQVADQAEGLSHSMRERPWRAVLADLEDGMRRRPDLFFAGALAAGFLFGRIVAGATARDAAEV
jgi:ElaB/YqjD/DUF883 family membrane-anchored ribosome-binding protein